MNRAASRFAALSYRGLIVLDILREDIDVHTVIDLVSRRNRAPTRGSVLCVTEPQEGLNFTGTVLDGFVLVVRISGKKADTSAALYSCLGGFLGMDDLLRGQSRVSDSFRTGDHPYKDIWQTVLRLIKQGC